MPPVTRQDALRIAEDYLQAHPHPNHDGIKKVTTILDLEEFMIRRPCVYGLTPERALTGAASSVQCRFR
jgi:hypothetical protein